MAERKTEQQVREDITNLFVFEYIPKLKDEVTRFNIESLSKHQLAVGVSEICGKSIGVFLGELKVADPTNALIDKIVEYVRVHTNE